MFRFIKNLFFIGSLFLSSLVSTTALSCISIKNQACKARPDIINVNSNNPLFYPFSIKASKCSGNCNNINDPYAKICAPDNVKDLNVKVFNLISRTNKTRYIKWQETCKCIYRLDAIVCNINNVGIMTNVVGNVKNYLIKVYAIKDMLRILVNANLNVIKGMMLVSI